MQSHWGSGLRQMNSGDTKVQSAAGTLPRWLQLTPLSQWADSKHPTERRGSTPSGPLLRARCSVRVLSSCPDILVRIDGGYCPILQMRQGNQGWEDHSRSPGSHHRPRMGGLQSPAPTRERGCLPLLPTMHQLPRALGTCEVLVFVFWAVLSFALHVAVLGAPIQRCFNRDLGFLPLFCNGFLKLKRPSFMETFYNYKNDFFIFIFSFTGIK